MVIPMEKIKKIRTKAFEEGSRRNAGSFFIMCIESAFSDHNFRGIEITKFDAPSRTIEGKSWHHTFSVRRVVVDQTKLWEVTCKRIGDSEAPERTVLLTNDTLEIYNK